MAANFLDFCPISSMTAERPEIPSSGGRPSFATPQFLADQNMLSLVLSKVLKKEGTQLDAFSPS